MGRRRRMWGEGSVYFRTSDHRWIARVEVHDGRPGRHQRTKSCRSMKDAKRALSALRSSPATDETVGEYLERWLRDGLGTVRPRTASGYSVIVRSHLVPAFGGRGLDALSPADVQRFVADQLRRYAPRSVAHQLAVLRTALAAAEREGSVPRNVASLVKGPHIPDQEIRPLSQAEASAFLSSVKGDRLEALYVLALHTGMRQGELLGLRWEDIDLERGEVHVRRSLSKWATLDDLKTERSRRTVPIGKSVVATLREHQRRQLQERTSNPRRVEQGLVFAGEYGSPLNGTEVTRRFQRQLQEAGLPRKRFHDLRHTAASLMLADGVAMRTIADMLGHSTPSLTANVYSHLGDGALRDVADRMDRAIGGTNG